MTHIHHPIIVPVSDLEGLIIAVRSRYSPILLLHHHLRWVLSGATLHRHSLLRLTRRHDIRLNPISLVLLLVYLVAIAARMLLLLKLLLSLLLKLLLLLTRHLLLLLLHHLLLLLHLHLPRRIDRLMRWVIGRLNYALRLALSHRLHILLKP